MKKIIFTLALLCALGGQAAGVQPKHRAHQQTEQVDQKANETADANADADNSEGIEAYSDTSSVADSTDVDSAYTTHVYTQTVDVDTPIDAFDNFMKSLGTPLQWLIVILIFFSCIIFFLAPIIIIALILRYLIKRHNSKLQFAEKAMASGQPIPNDTVPAWTIEGKWQKGVRNVAIGVGLALMFFVMGAEEIAGVGLLIACIGGGQMYTAKKMRQQRDSDTTDGRHHNFYSESGFYGESTGRTDQPNTENHQSETNQDASADNGETKNDDESMKA